MPDSQHLPFATDAIDRARHRAAVVIFQRTTSEPPSGLQNCAFFQRPRDGYTIPSKWKESMHGEE
jgi:hypothetical protein